MKNEVIAVTNNIYIGFISKLPSQKKETYSGKVTLCLDSLH